jgi:hypothetical protein
MSRAQPARGRFRKVWGAPVLLGAMGLIGLISALVGDGVMDAVSYLLLAVPVAVIAWHVAKRTR